MTVESPLSAVQRLQGPAPLGAGTVPRLPGAKVRVLETADRLFYHEGIRVVGVDRLIAEASVTKATFYKHFGAKDTLVVDYVTGRHDADVAEFTRLTDDAVDAGTALAALVDAIITRCSVPTTAAPPTRMPQPSSATRRTPLARPSSSTATG